MLPETPFHRKLAFKKRFRTDAIMTSRYSVPTLLQGSIQARDPKFDFRKNWRKTVARDALSSINLLSLQQDYDGSFETVPRRIWILILTCFYFSNFLSFPFSFPFLFFCWVLCKSRLKILRFTAKNEYFALTATLNRFRSLPPTIEYLHRVTSPS